MSELFNQLSNIDTKESVSKQRTVEETNRRIKGNNYTVIESNDQKPWGAYFRFSNDDADRFVEEFFPGLSPTEARLGDSKTELSPKILLVSPNQRLSWQYHNRRSERWAFLTKGAYEKSLTDDEGNVIMADAGESVQFSALERHRLVGRVAMYTLVAEIWQHTDPDNPSSEDDVVRLADDYLRS